MRIPMEVHGQLAARFEVLLPHLNERQQRLALAVEARLLGHGGVRAVAQVAGVSETTVRKGVVELEADEVLFRRPRPPAGWGRKSAARQDPDLVPALLALVEPDERGDPTSPLRWTTKSLRRLAEELTRQGHRVSAPTVGRLLRENGFSLQATAKTLEGNQHPDRGAQFRYINEQVKQYQDASEPVISVDAKLHQLIERLSVLQAAQIERRRHQRRGGARLPGARGGIFRQKITDAERILATVLCQRGACTRQVLADLFEVSPRTIGNALLEVRPLLEQDGHLATPAKTRSSSAGALLASVPPAHGQRNAPQPPR